MATLPTLLISSNCRIWSTYLYRRDISIRIGLLLFLSVVTCVDQNRVFANRAKRQ